MVHGHRSWQPDAACGMLVFGCATIIFPLHLGWTGASFASFAMYLALACSLFCTADLLSRPRANQLQILSQTFLWLLALAAPASLAYAAGSFLGPVDEAIEDSFCSSRQELGDDTLGAEDDDTFDVTPDCLS